MADSDSSTIKEAEVKYHHEQVEKPEGLVEEVTGAAKSLLDDVTAKSSSYTAQVEGLVSGLSSGGGSEALPTSDKTAADSSEAAKQTATRELDIESTQPSGSQRASWKNCFGLLDCLQSPDR